ncbi:MAG: tryptophan synthase subunit alpha, partial [Sphingomicrobium sp.]
DVPLGILTYANLVMARGRTDFFNRAAAAGTDSLLIADVPAREIEPWAMEMRAAELDPVLIAASNTPPETLAEIARLGAGYTYCVTRAGITGVHAAAEFDRGLIAALAEAGAAGVISGSAIVSLAAQGGDVARFVATLKAATRNDSAA